MDDIVARKRMLWRLINLLMLSNTKALTHLKLYYSVSDISNEMLHNVVDQVANGEATSEPFSWYDRHQEVC